MLKYGYYSDIRKCSIEINTKWGILKEKKVGKLVYLILGFTLICLWFRLSLLWQYLPLVSQV